MIKKNQILELKSLFSKASLYTKESIYIIVNAEKMNKDSANTMLKFLEEPDGDVIGFFITNERDNIIPTISSRCQLIEADFTNETYEKYNITLEKYEILKSILNEYIYKLEVENNNSILYNKQYIKDLDKNDEKILLQIMLDIYKDALNNKYLKKEMDKNYEYLNNYSFINLKKKVNLLIELLKEISYNINTDLLFDRLVIEIEAINNENL